MRRRADRPSSRRPRSAAMGRAGRRTSAQTRERLGRGSSDRSRRAVKTAGTCGAAYQSIRATVLRVRRAAMLTARTLRVMLAVSAIVATLGVLAYRLTFRDRP